MVLKLVAAVAQTGYVLKRWTQNPTLDLQHAKC